MTDPLERIKSLLDEIERGRSALRQQVSVAEMEVHQLRRRLARAEDAYKEVDQLNQQLKGQLAAAEGRVENAVRATREHVGRTA